MTKIAISPNASGTGTFTIAAPNSNTDRTFTLPDATGEVLTTAGGTFTGPITGTDLTLSGGVFLGGTGSANLLDDYEEGTWTATMAPFSGFTPTNNTVTGFYTKVGRVVTVTALARMDVPSSLGTYVNNNTNFFVIIEGLPFVIIDSLQARSAPVIGVANRLGTSDGALAGNGTNGGTSFNIFQNKDNGSTRTSPNLPTSNRCELHFCFTYFTN